MTDEATAGKDPAQEEREKPLALFNTPDVQNSLQRIVDRLEHEFPDYEIAPKHAQLRQTLGIIKNNAVQFDENCQMNVRWNKSTFARELEIVARKPLTDVDELYGTIFRFMIEFELTIQNDLSMELRAFITFADEQLIEFNTNTQKVITWSRLQMPVAIMKNLLNSKPLQNLRDIGQLAQQVDVELKKFSKELTDSESRAEVLRGSLESYKIGFNFVGLFQGFDDLSNAKLAEIAGWRKWLLLFGLLGVTPLCIELIVVYFNRDRIEELKWFFVASAVPIVSLTVLFIYFFRIALRGADAARSQLLQIELRKTLCRFIQSYAEYTKGIKEGSLAKFENIIFSGIVASDERLPTTFDGLEQLTGMIKAFQRKPT